MARFVILSASMGAGHDQVARELANRLQAGGDDAIIMDALEILPARLGALLRSSYNGMLNCAPWLYEGIYQTFFVDRGRPGADVSPLAALLARRLSEPLRQAAPDAVASTFHLGAQAVGQLRSSGQLTVPAVVVVTDFVAHRVWLHPGNDLFCCLHPDVAASVVAVTGRPAWVTGPLLASAFTGGPGTGGPRTGASGRRSREQTREQLGLEPADLAALISSGSWGAGAVERVAGLLSTTPGLVPVVLCGHNEVLRRRLVARFDAHSVTRSGSPAAPALDTSAAPVPGKRAARRAEAAGRAVTLGWRDDVADVMRACDVLVDNAAGLTSLEALATGLPVVSFRPIPGHGRDGVRRMAAAGLVNLVADGGGPDHERGALRDAVFAAVSGPAVDDLFSPPGVDAATALRLLASDPLAVRSPHRAFPAMIGREVHDLSRASRRSGGSGASKRDAVPAARRRGVSGSLKEVGT